MPIGEEILAELRKFEEETGYGQFDGLPAGTYHMVVDGYEVHKDAEGLPYLRLQYKVVCGVEEDMKQSDFFRAFGKTGGNGKKTEAEADDGAHRFFYGRMKELQSAMSGDTYPFILLTRRLAEVNRSKSGIETAEAMMNEIGVAIEHTTFYARVKLVESMVNFEKRVNTRIKAIGPEAPDATCGCVWQGKI
jgi:hypothetical protein